MLTDLKCRLGTATAAGVVRALLLRATPLDMHQHVVSCRTSASGSCGLLSLSLSFPLPLLLLPGVVDSCLQASTDALCCSCDCHQAL